MKRVFIFTLMFLASVALIAQNTATTTQTGNGNSADIDQTGMNGAVLVQTGDNNTADADQTGINALEGSQIGNDNDAVVSQSNTATDPADANIAIFEQGGGIYNGSNTGDDNTLSITQDGVRNYAKSREYYSDNEVVIEQLGDDGYATQWIWAAGAGNVAKQFQDGDRNHSKIAMNGLDGNNSAISTQTGDDNWNEIGQGWSGRAHGSNTAEVTQTGNNNQVTIDPGLSLPGYTVDLHGMGIHQYGTGNNAQIEQVGDDNVAGVYQFDAGDQAGDYNDAVIVIAGNTNDVLAIQLGDMNEAYVDITGDGNDVNIDQNGNSNDVGTAAAPADGVVVIGNSNVVDISQMNDGHSATAYQNGNGNTSTITQQ